MGFTIRPARQEDDPELARIDYESWSPINSPSPLWERSRPFFGDPTGTRVEDVLVAEDEGRTLGYVKFSTQSERPSTLRINGLGVDEPARGRGIGVRLVNAAMALARDRGFTAIDLKVLGSNAPALRVYQKAGFLVEERTEGRFVIEGHPVDDLTLVVTL